jgi:hypothetical protein
MKQQCKWHKERAQNKKKNSNIIIKSKTKNKTTATNTTTTNITYSSNNYHNNNYKRQQLIKIQTATKTTPRI